MGLRSTFRNWLVRKGFPVPAILVRPHDRFFHETVNSVRPGMVILDIGANKGEVAAAFAARGAIVHAFEPNPDIYADLVAVAAKYAGIKAHNCGVFDCDTEMKLYLHTDYADDPRMHSESSSLLTEKPNVSTENYRVVPLRDIAGVVKEVGQVDIAKIDVEGAEYRIIMRLIETGTWKQIGQILVETHHDRIESLRPEFEAVQAEIARQGIGDRFRFDWV